MEQDISCPPVEPAVEPEVVEGEVSAADETPPSTPAVDPYQYLPGTYPGDGGSWRGVQRLSGQ